MTAKILCPWCGAEMCPTATADVITKEWRACYICPDDPYVSSPEVGGFKTVEEALEAAEAAALRRYTPPLRPLTPMTVEEVRKEILAWLETKDWKPQKVEMIKRTGGVVFRLADSPELYGVHYDTYNKDWRCWSHEPTDEERSAAEWENSR